MSEAKLSSHGVSQAVCLPKEFHFDCTEVHVRQVGSEVVLSALPRASLQAMLDALDALDIFEPGAQLRREQPEERKRVAIKPRR